MSTKIRLLAVLVLVSSMFTAMTAGAFAHHGATEDYYPIATDEFEAVWERTDLPVHELIVARTWIWSPAAHTPLLTEEYVEGEGGVREVQYFDKSRMEMPTLGVADPGDEESPWFITQGLLATELMTGNLQLGDDTFEQHQPSQRSAAGDPGDTTAPTYAVMGGHMDTEARVTDEVIVEFMDREGNITEDDRFADYGVTDAHFDEVTEHNIASVFWDFMNSQTIIYEDGEYVEDDLFLNPYYAVGRPHTEAYWAWVTVDHVEQDVLIQCFERRCLTYTPGNPEGWEVESGNIGQHYYAWRYHEIPAEVPVTPGISLEPEIAENDLYILDLEPLGVEPEDPFDVAWATALSVDLADDLVVLTHEQVENLITWLAMSVGEIEILDLNALTPEQLAVLNAFEAETGINLLTVPSLDPDEEEMVEQIRAFSVTLLVLLETEGPVAIDDLDPEAAAFVILALEMFTGIDLQVVDLAELNQHTVVATVGDALGEPVAGVEIDFVVTADEDGAIIAEDTIATGADGTATLTYMAVDEGDETIIATAIVNDTLLTASAAKTWTVVPTIVDEDLDEDLNDFPIHELVDPTLKLAPASAENQVGTEHIVTATLLDEGVPVENAFVFFWVEGANKGASDDLDVTNALGQASFSYIGMVEGEDQIYAEVDWMEPDGIIDILVAEPVTKVWIGGDIGITGTSDDLENTSVMEFFGR
jgi:hypothetical protein